MKIGFIGGGKMAEAIIRGLVQKKFVHPPEILVSDVDKKRLNYFKSKGFRGLIIDKRFIVNIVRNNQELTSLSDIIILAVKPQDVAEAILGIQINEGKLLISIAAGISISYLEKVFPRVAVIRAMPNNPALVGVGITALAVGKRVSKKQLDFAKQIFSAVGEVVDVPEKWMDAVTGLSGSGPAFVYQVIDALIEGGKKSGLPQAVAQKLALQTVLGAVEVLKKIGISPRDLVKMVASPGGTTIEGLRVLKKARFQSVLTTAVVAAAKKSKLLSKKWAI